MWRPFLRIVICAGLIGCGYGQTNETAKMQQLIQAINTKEGSTIAAQFPDAEVVGLLEMLPEYKELTTLSATNWQSAISNLSTVAPDKTSRVILLHSFEALAPNDYLSFADQSLNLLSAKQIDRNEFLHIVLMSPTKKRWFLSYNYQNPGVINFLNRVRSQFATDRNIPTLVDFILSGKARERDERLRAGSPYLSKQSIDLLPGSTDPGAASATPAPAVAVAPSAPSTPRASASPAATVTAEKPSSSSFPIVPVAILVAVIVGVAVFLLGRRSRQEGR